ncbi:PD-(D/E)XK nuclease family protein [Candidatus Peregrinibacteria bacterium]|jgi:ATP-dependent helicase/DNAse subunit B|nr:PD-(D/E)XK nuclease family protein [Candidatus Peregrinibacteria bacterium]
MTKDKYSATWVSHSSISDWLACPRAYFLKNVYKDPKTGHKISLMSPPLALGSAVHEVVEGLSVLPTDKRFDESLIKKFDKVWGKFSGKKGGFGDEAEEGRYKERGKKMLRRVMKYPGPLKNLAVKIQMDLPNYWLSEEDNIILCGKIDWLEYLKDEDMVHIIDFKTGKRAEQKGSLQLPIYYLLVTNTQKRAVKKASYWHIDLADEPMEQKLPDIKKANEKILKIAKEIKLARTLERFKCPNDGCRACKPMEKIIKGEGEFVGVDEIRRDIYILPRTKEDKPEGKIL